MLGMRLMVRTITSGEGNLDLLTDTTNSVHEIAAVYLVGACLGLALSPVVATVFTLQRSLQLPGGRPIGTLTATVAGLIGSMMCVVLPLLGIASAVSFFMLDANVLDWNSVDMTS